jgi:hypothetical protein
MLQIPVFWGMQIIFMKFPVRISSERATILIESFRDFSQLMEGRGFQARLGKWISSISVIHPAALDPRIYSVSGKNEYQKRINIVSEE